MNYAGNFMKDRLFVITGLFLILGLAFPAYIELLLETMIFAILAVSFNFMLGYIGLLSFCHAALFGLGAYTMGILLIHFQVNIFLGLLAGSLLAAGTAMLIGWISILRVGLYFSMLTLAFNEVIYFTVFQLKGLTGGDDGLRGIYRPDVDFGISSFPIQNPLTFYFFVLFFFATSILIMRRIIDSPFGSVFVAIRENERRSETIGYNTRYYKIVGFTISGFFAGLAGALFCINIKFAAVNLCHWSLSGEVILMALIGGTGSLYGPIIGAGMVTVMRSLFALLWDRWLLILGVVFLIFVMFFRGGVWEGIETLISHYSRRLRREAPS